MGVGSDLGALSCECWLQKDSEPEKNQKRFNKRYNYEMHSESMYSLFNAAAALHRAFRANMEEDKEERAFDWFNNLKSTPKIFQKIFLLSINKNVKSGENL